MTDMKRKTYICPRLRSVELPELCQIVTGSKEPPGINNQAKENGTWWDMAEDEE